MASCRGRLGPPVIALWSTLSFAALWLLLLGMGWIVGLAIRRLEQDDGAWRRGL